MADSPVAPKSAPDFNMFWVAAELVPHAKSVYENSSAGKYILTCSINSLPSPPPWPSMTNTNGILIIPPYRPSMLMLNDYIL